jgi:filamentous hemagglutinin family protein
MLLFHFIQSNLNKGCLGKGFITSIGLGIGQFCLVQVGVQIAEPVAAQISPDRTLPQSSRVETRGNTQEITGGTQVGRNLFHSFERFSVPRGGTAFFNNNAAIEFIFSRVTGNSASQIDGLLRANGSANLFLLNPNGIVFGRNASLDIGGTFIGSTADQIRFADGAEFGAVNPQAAPLLTVSLPVGLQFGTHPAPIQVQGNGHGLFLNSPDNPTVNRTNRPTGLAVNPGQTLALVGGDLTLGGGNLTATAGRIELGSVAGGEVRLNPQDWRLDYGNVEQFRDVRLTEAASLETSGNRGGVIKVQGRNIQITETSALLADTLGTGTGGSLILNATERVQVSGFGLSATGNPFVSRLSTDVAPNATGEGGNVTITAQRLQISNGGQISSGTFSAGDAGSLRVRVTDLEISGGSLVGPSGLFAPVEAAASGNGGSLTITAERLRITDGAQVSTSTFGAGNAGTLTVQANEVELSGRSSGLFAIVERGASGNGDTLTLVADRLQIRDGAQITTLTAGGGDAGDLTVRADQIELVGRAGQFASGLLTSVEPEATGRGGRLTVYAEQLQIRQGSEISATTFGTGDAGNVTIQAEQIDVSGGTVESPSNIAAASIGTGNGGDLVVIAQQLRVTNGGQIAAASASRGDAGNLTINAAESIELSGRTAFGSSGLFGSALGEGAGGNLMMRADRLTVADGAVVSVSNFSSADPSRPPGQGSVGNLTVNANQILLDNRATLTANSAAGDRGNITLQSDNILLRQQSAITTNATGRARGGNINIDTNILAASENSDIAANAQNNFGGQVLIRAEAVLGTQARTQLTSESDITASSALGPQFSGTVQIDTQESDPNQGIVQLPDNLIDASNQIAAACNQTAGNSFVVTGRGGLPEAPIQLLRGETIWEDVRVAEMEDDEIQNETNRAIQPNPNQDSLVEAQGWKINQMGQVVLVAQSQTYQPQVDANCADE